MAEQLRSTDYLSFFLRVVSSFLQCVTLSEWNCVAAFDVCARVFYVFFFLKRNGRRKKINRLIHVEYGVVKKVKFETWKHLSKTRQRYTYSRINMFLVTIKPFNTCFYLKRVPFSRHFGVIVDLSLQNTRITCSFARFVHHSSGFSPTVFPSIYLTISYIIEIFKHQGDL